MPLLIWLKRDRFDRVFDTDGDGTLTRSEITEALKVLGKSISPQDRQNIVDRISDREIVTKDRFIEWMSQRQDINRRSH